MWQNWIPSIAKWAFILNMSLAPTRWLILHVSLKYSGKGAWFIGRLSSGLMSSIRSADCRSASSACLSTGRFRPLHRYFPLLSMLFRHYIASFSVDALYCRLMGAGTESHKLLFLNWFSFIFLRFCLSSFILWLAKNHSSSDWDLLLFHFVSVAALSHILNNCISPIAMLDNYSNLHHWICHCLYFLFFFISLRFFGFLISTILWRIE